MDFQQLVLLASFCALMMGTVLIHLRERRRRSNRANQRAQWGENLATKLGALDSNTSDLPDAGIEPQQKQRKTEKVVVLTPRQRQFLEAWHRNCAALHEHWTQEAAVAPGQLTEYQHVRNIRPQKNSLAQLKALGVENLIGIKVVSEGQAKDLLNLLEKPDFEMVAFLRFCGQSASRFNKTTADIYFQNCKRVEPSLVAQWRDRPIDPINVCAMHFFQVDLRSLRKNGALVLPLDEHIAVQPKEKQRQWKSVENLLLRIERGDFASTHLVPALTCRFVYRLVYREHFFGRSIKEGGAIDEEAVLTTLRNLSAHVKWNNSFDGGGNGRNTKQGWHAEDSKLNDGSTPSSTLLKSLPQSE